MIKFPKIVGILNVTPDSFSDGGKFIDKRSAVRKALSLLEEGADILDIGGESTRPGAALIDVHTEIERIIPVIKELKQFDKGIKISVDTTKHEVAKEALDAGCDMLNDVSGLRFDRKIAELAAIYDVPLILMHSRHKPSTMQQNPYYANLWRELIDELTTSIKIAKLSNVNNIIIDPGIGFAKNYEHNLEILKNIDYLSELNCPVMLGISRKSFIGKMLEIANPAERDFATILLHTLLLKNNVDYVRVHNVRLMNMTKTIMNNLFTL